MDYCLQGCVIERLTGKAYAMEDFQEVIASIITAGMKLNKRSHALQLMVYLQEADLDVRALLSFLNWHNVRSSIRRNPMYNS